MVISYEKTYKIFKNKENQPKTKVIFVSPKGKKLNNDMVMSI